MELPPADIAFPNTEASGTDDENIEINYSELAGFLVSLTSRMLVNPRTRERRRVRRPLRAVATKRMGAVRVRSTTLSEEIQ